MKKIRLSLSFKERKTKFSISQVRIFFKKKWIDFLKLNDNLELVVEYNEKNNKECIICKKFSNEEDLQDLKTKNSLLVEKKILTKKIEKNKESYTLTLPTKFHEILEQNGFRGNVDCLYEEKRNEIKIYLPLEEPKKNVILFKVNKGGVGKTFLTCQVGHGLAKYGKKVLIITSDSQNNVLNYMSKQNLKIENGIIKDVLYNKDGRIKLRENLDFIPLESNKFGEVFIRQLPIWIKAKKNEYDYILIDSVPTMKIDHEFIVLANKIIIPAFCDEATIEGILNLLNDVKVEDVLAIQINKYKNRVIENKYKEMLERAIQSSNILMPKPIKDMSFIQLMLDKKKTIWEYRNKKVDEVQDIISDLIVKIINEV